MLEKIKNLIIGARNKVASMSPKIMAVIVGYFIAVVLLVLTYYAAWMYMWLWLDKIVMSDLLALIREVSCICDFYSYEFSRQKREWSARSI